ncbi:MAG TPA: rRNA maturation RNase YbeY [Terriglobales bacterium]|nr:rRNA maturation RNase YbeY [Terriglobales bacterium]
MVILHKPVPKLNESALARFVIKACKAVGLKGNVNVLVTSSQEMRSLNRRFRGKDKPTDVLSFPSIAEFAAGLAGDVAISQEIATKNARAIGHAPADEIKILTLHGVLHLAGYDHESDNGEMAQQEDRLRRKLGLPVGLIERSGKLSTQKR